MQTLTKTTLSSQAIESIKEYITSSGLQAGDKLPPEREFCEMLNVSSRVVREALKSLESLGIIRIVVGDGLYVAEMSYTKLANHMGFFFRQSNHDLHYLYEARMLLELAAIENVAQKVTDEDLAVLRGDVKMMAKAKTVEDNVHADNMFHKHLVGIAGNPILDEFCNFIDEFFAASVDDAYEYAVDTDPANHGALVDLIATKDTQAIRIALRSHLSTREW